MDEHIILIQKLTIKIGTHFVGKFGMKLSAEGVENGTSETCQNLCTGKSIKQMHLPFMNESVLPAIKTQKATYCIIN